jgi:hypothetical protein
LATEKLNCSQKENDYLDTCAAAPSHGLLIS